MYSFSQRKIPTWEGIQTRDGMVQLLLSIIVGTGRYTFQLAR